MRLYHNTAACWNMEKKSPVKSGNPVIKEYKCGGKSKQHVILSKPLKSPGQKKIKTWNKKLSKKNQHFLEGLGLKVKQSVENC